MRMTAHTDYAMRVLVYVAGRPDEACTVGEVAGVYGLSRNHLMKVAQSLRDFGAIQTLRGRAGGIRLARPAETINIGALVRTIEEDFSVVDCLQAGGGTCVIAPACLLKGMISEAIGAFLAVLDTYTLADIVKNRNVLGSLLGIDARAA